MNHTFQPLPTLRVETLIVSVRGQKVVLDRDLARIYGVATKVLNQAVKRNAERFPKDFVFQLSGDEAEVESLSKSQAGTPLSDQAELIRSQIVTGSQMPHRMRSQAVTASKRNLRYRPYAFTEHGAIMAANVLTSPQAVTMSVFVVRAFVKMREALGHNRALAGQLAELERKLTDRLNVHEQAIVQILSEI